MWYVSYVKGRIALFNKSFEASALRGFREVTRGCFPIRILVKERVALFICLRRANAAKEFLHEKTFIGNAGTGFGIGTF